MPMDELWMLFKDAQDSRQPWPHHPSSRRASLRSPSSKTGGAAKEIPVLLTTNFVLFCSPRDSGVFFSWSARAVLAGLTTVAQFAVGRREPIFRDNADRQRFVETLAEACAKTGW